MAFEEEDRMLNKVARALSKREDERNALKVGAKVRIGQSNINKREKLSYLALEQLPNKVDEQ